MGDPIYLTFPVWFCTGRSLSLHRAFLGPAFSCTQQGDPMLSALHSPPPHNPQAAESQGPPPSQRSNPHSFAPIPVGRSALPITSMNHTASKRQDAKQPSFLGGRDCTFELSPKPHDPGRQPGDMYAINSRLENTSTTAAASLHTAPGM